MTKQIIILSHDSKKGTKIQVYGTSGYSFFIPADGEGELPKIVEAEDQSCITGTIVSITENAFALQKERDTNRWVIQNLGRFCPYLMNYDEINEKEVTIVRFGAGQHPYVNFSPETVAEQMLPVHEFAAELLKTPKGQALSKQGLKEAEADDLESTAELISMIYDRGSMKMGGCLSYFFMLYEMTKYVREKSQEFPYDEKKALMLVYVEEGEKELRWMVETEDGRLDLMEEAEEPEKPPREPRRYGVEVDRYEDVGHIYLEEGYLPVRSMYPEERASVPEEILSQESFIYPAGKPWCEARYNTARGFYHGLPERSAEEIEEDYRKTCEYMRKVLKLGLGVRYIKDDILYERDGNRNIYRFYWFSNERGTISWSHKGFLRKATPEDDALYDLYDV